MPIDTLKKIRIILTYINGITFFIGVQFTFDATGYKSTFFEALGGGIFLFGLLYSMFSDWMYYDQLIDKGAKIKYESFQKIGLIAVILMLCTISVAFYNSLHNGQIGILSVLIAVPIIYFLIQWIFSKK